MMIAFVGMKKDYSSIDRSYIQFFNKYHLEIPWYFAQCGDNDVKVVTTTKSFQEFPESFSRGGKFQVLNEDDYDYILDVDVVIHWREWQEKLCRPNAINLLHTCDHSYPEKWKADVRTAYASGKLQGILCYRSWHQRHIQSETGLPFDRLYTDCTFGVDTDIYKPSVDKDPYQMLWSSDPGRGLTGAIETALALYSVDKRFKLHICYPDYVKTPQKIDHPALVWHGFISNGPKLWDLFNTTGILPYTSTFAEPSSRAHRQAQAAGSLVLYPSNMGSPSELIVDDVTGIVVRGTSFSRRILELVQNGRWEEIGKNAREFAISENWDVQAKRFNELIKRLSAEKRT